MNAENVLLRLYEDWRTLTFEEKRAIAAADWAGLAEAQHRKRLLQDRAASLQDPEHRNAAFSRPEGWRLRQVIEELVALEKDNAEALQVCRTTAEANAAALHRSCRNLKQVRSAYSQGHRPGWHSYS